ncbi:uncharacterized protein TNCV_238811 [Trichonephila clavipes]|nr:uncharacterized protein TNCV_238811 [Trichonephila clavipes]
MTEKMPSRGIRAHYEQLSEFKRGRIIELKEAGWTNRRIARHMGRSGAASRRCWQEWVENACDSLHPGWRWINTLLSSLLCNYATLK